MMCLSTVTLQWKLPTHHRYRKNEYGDPLMQICRVPNIPKNAAILLLILIHHKDRQDLALSMFCCVTKHRSGNKDHRCQSRCFQYQAF